MDLKEVFNKKAVQILLNHILIKYKIDIKDKKPSFKLLYNLLKNKLAVLH